MARAAWIIPPGTQNKTSNVTITVTDNAAVLTEGEVVTATCNNKTFTSTLHKGKCKIYSTEVGTYTISAGEYNTMLICPYYGQFSTDIYSGVLKVTCIESGGIDKTCQVRSCDEEYNFTDDYSLTQTFDSSLELTFMGIPTGKYLITIDDRYRFFKEITSIQNINSIDVELKQWLYNHGSQCEWNTGGWMQCQCNGSATTRYTSNSPAWYSTGAYNQSTSFTDSALRIYQKCTSQEGIRRNSGGGVMYACRAIVSSNSFMGTIKQIPILMSKYSKTHYTATKPLTIAVRTGVLNNENTNTSTATVLISGTASDIDMNIIEADGMIVIGQSFYDAGYGYTYNGSTYNGTLEHSSHGNLNYELTSDITEIYLV